jgi:hypothetical protein
MMGLDDARQMELLRQQLAMNRAQQGGGIAYEGQLGRKYGIDRPIDAAEPTDQERWLGAAQGLGQAYLQYRAGQSPQGSEPSSPSYFGTTDPSKKYQGL